MKNEIQILKYTELQSVREITIKSEPWFLGQDICEILTISNVSDALANLDDDEKLLSEITIAGQRRKVLFVNESGLYHLIFKSQKPEANKFRKWITNEVLPQIRKTGMYVAPQEEIEAVQNLRKVVQAHALKFSQDADYLDWQEKKSQLNSWIGKQKHKVSKGINSLFDNQTENAVVETEFETVNQE